MLCKCGCGKETNPNRHYIKHHHFRGRKLTKQHKQSISKTHKGKKTKEETKIKMRLAALGNKNHFYGKKHTRQSKVKMSLSTSKKWLDPEYQKNYAKGRNFKRSSSEKTLEQLIKKLNLPYEYTGDVGKHRWQYAGNYLTIGGDRGLFARSKVDALKFVCECGASKIVKEQKSRS